MNMSKIFWLRSVCICLDGCPTGNCISIYSPVLYRTIELFPIFSVTDSATINYFVLQKKKKFLIDCGPKFKILLSYINWQKLQVML